MTPELTRLAGRYILYDADCAARPGPEWFDPAHWQASGRVRGAAPGRGTTLFVDSDIGPLALRHYRRGGWFRHLLGDRYLWTGLERTRAVREWRLLAHLAALGLPVPVPVAAQVVHDGLHCRADLLTRRLPDVQSLAARLAAPLPATCWRDIGRTLQRFHRHGVHHADLNAHNILLGADGGVHVIDFDRGRVRAAGRWPAANLARLRRSLEKLAGLGRTAPFDAAGWQALLQGYAGQD